MSISREEEGTRAICSSAGGPGASFAKSVRERQIVNNITYRMGNTCKPMAVSFQCMTKSTTNKKIKKIKIKIKKKYHLQHLKSQLIVKESAMVVTL